MEQLNQPLQVHAEEVGKLADWAQVHAEEEEHRQALEAWLHRSWMVWELQVQPWVGEGLEHCLPILLPAGGHCLARQRSVVGLWVHAHALVQWVGLWVQAAAMVQAVQTAVMREISQRS